VPDGDAGGAAVVVGDGGVVVGESAAVVAVVSRAASIWAALRVAPAGHLLADEADALPGDHGGGDRGHEPDQAEREEPSHGVIMTPFPQAGANRALRIG
jgi:hypothetical protein